MQAVRSNKAWIDNLSFKKSLTLFRNKNVARMCKFLGYQYNGIFFLHSLALKPFYASTYKTSIFFLSQLFQSLRWEMNNQIHRFLLKTSAIRPSVAHNVVWFCRVENYLDSQHGRKVALPVEENLHIQSKLVMDIILSKMNKTESDFFNTETNFLEKITSISGILKPSQSKDEKKAIIREKLIQYNQEIPPNVYLPTNQKCRVVGIVTTSGMPMQSAARVPILVSFEVQDYEGPDQDPALTNSQHGQQEETFALKPLKQHQKLKQIQANLQQQLLKMNVITYDEGVAQLKMLEDLQDLIEKNQLVNFNQFQIDDIYQDYISQLNSSETSGFEGADANAKYKKNASVFENTLKTHILQINAQPTLKIKMSQYQIHPKPNLFREDDVEISCAD